MFVSGIQQALCFPSLPKASQELQGSISCSLDSRLPDIEVDSTPPPGAVVISFESSTVKQEELPPNVLCRITKMIGTKELKSLHMVNRAWRDAVCQGLGTAVIQKGSLDLLTRFPNVRSLGLRGVHLKHADTSQLGGLQSLVLRDCAFKNSISDLATLQALRKLRLQDVQCSCQGDCDLVLAKLTALTHLEWTRTAECTDLSAFQMPTYSTLSCLTALQALTLSDPCQGLQIQNLPQVSALKGLTRLNISRGVVSEAMGYAIAELANLQSLDLTYCVQINDLFLQSISLLDGLTRLDLRSTGHPEESELTDRGVDRLSSLLRLEHLNLAGHRNLTSSGVAFLSSTTKLSSLCLAGSSLWTGGANFLRSLTSLQALNLSRTLLTAQQLNALQPLTRIQQLNLSETYLNDVAARQVAGMTSLETLKVSYCPLGNEGFHLITASCPHLTRVTIEGCWLSTLCVLKTSICHPKIKLWRSDHSWLPLWMRRLDVILIAQTQPFSRKLRALYQAEDTPVLTVGVGLGVIIFASIYTGVLLFIFTAVLLMPMFLLGILSLGMMAAALGARLFSGRMIRSPRLLQQLEALLFSSPDVDHAAAQERLEDLV